MEALMILMTLREICNLSGVTRRAVQGYEKHGLVKAVKTNKYGHLLYDEKGLERIRQIKLFQCFGYSLNEIEILVVASDQELKISLQKKLKILEQKLEETDELIAKLQEMIEELK